MKLISIKNLALGMSVVSVPSVYGANITIDTKLPSQEITRSIEAIPLQENQSKVSATFERFDQVQVFGKELSAIEGDSVNLTFKYGFSNNLSIGAGLQAIDESPLGSNDDLGDRKNNLTLDLHYRFLTMDYLDLAVIPFYSSGNAISNRYTTNSKGNVGAVLSMSLGEPILRSTINTYYRSRGNEHHFGYNTLYDWGSSIMLKAKIGYIGFFGEIAEQNLVIERLDNGKDDVLVSQNHTVGIEITDYFAIFAKRAMANKLIGSAEKSYGIQVSYSFGEPSSRVADDDQDSDEIPDERSHSNEAVNENTDESANSSETEAINESADETSKDTQPEPVSEIKNEPANEDNELNTDSKPSPKPPAETSQGTQDVKVNSREDVQIEKVSPPTKKTDSNIQRPLKDYEDGDSTYGSW